MNEHQFSKMVSAAGGRAYIVGGWNRDKLMGVTPKDKDYCLTGFNKEKFLRVFPNAIQVIGEKGKQTVDVFLLEIDGEVQEIALARKEVKTGEGYHGFAFISDEFVRIEEDLLRRDLTINAIAFDILDERYVYPSGAMDDLKNGILRATSDAFYEDPLRVYRVAVRHAITGFEVEERTKSMMIKAAKELTAIPKERVVQELRKAFVSEHPDLFFRLLEELEILPIHFEELAALKGVPQPAQTHPEGDVFEHTMQVLVAMRNLTDKEHLLFSALVHDFGKAITPEEILPKHHGHEEEGVPIVNKFCKRLGVPSKWRKSALVATENHGRFHRLQEMRDVKTVDLLTKIEKSALTVEGLTLIGLADARGKGNPTATHPNVSFALRVIQAIQQVKGNRELEGQKAWQDKRLRQAKLIKAIKEETSI